MSSVSCVIPTHGRPQFLGEAIDSVLSQTHPVAEIVVVSDDADEASRAVVAAAAGRSEVPIRWIENHELPGASGSRNVGAAATSAELIAFLDDDDLWAPEFLEHSLKILGPDDAAVVTWLEMFRGDRRGPGSCIDPGLRARDAAGRNPGYTGSNGVVRRQAFDAVGGFDPELRVINDRDFFYRFLLAGHAYAVNPRFEVWQRRHGDGQLTKATEMRAQGIERFMTKHHATLRRSDRKAMRLAAHRIRYHAAATRSERLRHLVLGALCSSRASVRESLTNWRQRKLWR